MRNTGLLLNGTVDNISYLIEIWPNSLANVYYDVPIDDDRIVKVSCRAQATINGTLDFSNTIKVSQSYAYTQWEAMEEFYQDVMLTVYCPGARNNMEIGINNYRRFLNALQIVVNDLDPVPIREYVESVVRQQMIKQRNSLIKKRGVFERRFAKLKEDKENNERAIIRLTETIGEENGEDLAK